MWTRAALSVAIGAVLGAVASVTSSGSIPPEPPCETVLASTRSRADELGSQLHQAARRIEAVRLRRAAVFGARRTWPEEPPPALRPDRVRTHLESALEGTDGELLELSCDAYPCIAVVGWDLSDEDLGLVDQGDGTANLPGALMARLQQGDYARLQFYEVGRMHEIEDGRSIHSMAWFSRDDARASRSPDDPGQADVEGTLVEQIRGRTEDRLDANAQEEGP